MIKLIIKQKGYTINIPGLPEVRTPTEMDITKKDVTIIIAELRKNGISDFEIVSVTNDIPKKQKQTKPNKKVKKDSNDINKRFDKLEELIVKSLDSNVMEKSVKRKSSDDEEELDFIPEINTDNLSSEISTKSTKIEDVSESVNQLRKMKGEK